MSKMGISVFFSAVLLLATAVANPSAHAQIFSVLYEFNRSSGNLPSSPGIVAQGRDGNLYTTAPAGGGHGQGTIFRITPGGALSVLYNFDGAHGAMPLSGLTLGSDGKFYGTTAAGGAYNAGVIFNITSGGKLTLLHTFTGGSDGANPVAPPIEGTDGNYYGTTAGAQDDGTIYRISPSGKFKTLYRFRANDVSTPLVQGTDGNFYGTTYMGGAHGIGTVFKMTPAGTLTVLHNFDGTHGSFPTNLIQGNDGYFYGATYESGTDGGVVYRISSAGIFKVLHYFDRDTEGGCTYAGLVQATDGNFYGETASGGKTGYGTIFRVTRQGQLSVLYNLVGTAATNPQDSLLQQTRGPLYGDTEQGGTQGLGVFYKVNAGLKPFVSLLTASGKAGQSVELLGQGFKGTTQVSFNGIPATYTVKSETYLRAVVPGGATNGFVTVVTPTGTLKSNHKFRVQP
jgi:uncharacterized repeat protein (TIGR03803 family)